MGASGGSRTRDEKAGGIIAPGKGRAPSRSRSRSKGAIRSPRKRSYSRGNKVRETPFKFGK